MRQQRKLTIDGTTYKVSGVEAQADGELVLVGTDALSTESYLVFEPQNDAVTGDVSLEDIQSVELPTVLAVTHNGQKYMYEFTRVDSV